MIAYTPPSSSVKNITSATRLLAAAVADLARCSHGPSGAARAHADAAVAGEVEEPAMREHRGPMTSTGWRRGGAVLPAHQIG